MTNKFVVSNSSPIMNLAIIGQLNILQKLFGSVTIPEEVWGELTANGGGKPGAKEIMQAVWIKRDTIKNDMLFQTLRKDLDAGEAAAITLAMERKASLILLDESDARNMAEFYNLHKTGILGVIMRAKRQGIIPEIKPLLEKIRDEANFWIKESLYHRVLMEMGE